MTSVRSMGAAAGAGSAAQLRAAFAEGRLVRVAGGHDGLTARLAEEAGFDAVWASGLEISAAHGLPDVSLFGLSDYLAAATTMRQAVGVPVIADCDTGFGDSLNAAYTMMRFEDSGIAAVCMEDKVFPKRNSFAEAEHDLLPADEFARKIDAAKRSQSTPDTVLIARTEAFNCGTGLDDAVRRCHSYVDAGADAVFVHSRAADPTEVVAFLERWRRRAPVVIAPTTFYQWTAAEAADAGVLMVIYANHGMRATIRSVRETWRRILADGCSGGVEDDIASIADVFDIAGLDDWLRLAR